jgi:uncharacterized membrane protein
MSRLTMRDISDQLSIWVLIAVLLFVVALEPRGILLLIVSIPFFGFIPGLMLFQLVVPNAKDPLVKGFTSVVLSAALSLSMYLAIRASFGGFEMFQLSLAMVTLVGILSLIVIKMDRPGSEQVHPHPLFDGLIGIREEYRSSGKRQKGVVLMSLAIIMVIVIASTGFLVTTKPDRWTEFYVLNDRGQAYNFTQNYSMNAPVNITNGIVNHEGKAVTYAVELWLVNYTNINMSVDVTQMYYVDSFNVTLDHRDFNMNDPWRSQFETNYSLNFQVTGNYTLYFMLFQDDKTQPLPVPVPDHTTDYAHTVASWRIVMIVNHQIQYLSLKANIQA